jgi:hypothetical protein
MPVDINSMRRRLRKALGLEVDDLAELSDDDADEYLNESFWSIQDKFPFREKEKTVRFSTVAGTRSYDMPKPFDALISLSVQDPNTNEFRKLERMSTDEYENKYDSDDDSQAIPTHYTREGCFARLWPTPDQAYVVSLKRLVTLDDLSNDVTTPDVPRVWWEIIRLGGLWRALIDFGDLTRANTIRIHATTLQNDVVPTQSKEERDSREAGVEVYRPEYRL